MKNEKQTYILGIILLIAVTVIAFLGGVIFQRRINNRAFSYAQPFYGRGMMGRGFMRSGFRMGYRQAGGFRGGMIAGQISAISGNSLTITLPGGITRTVAISSTSALVKTIPATQSDLKPGENVSIAGQPNSDGSINVQKVTIGL